MARTKVERWGRGVVETLERSGRRVERRRAATRLCRMPPGTTVVVWDGQTSECFMMAATILGGSGDKARVRYGDGSTGTEPWSHVYAAVW